MLFKFEVGYEGEMIGAYWAEDETDAIRQCRADLSGSDVKLATPARDRLKGMIAVRV